MGAAVHDEFDNSWLRRGLVLDELSMPQRRAIRRMLRVLAQAAALDDDERAQKIRSDIHNRGGWVYVGGSCLKVEFEEGQKILRLLAVARCVPKAQA